jgi:hypothetical protein
MLTGPLLHSRPPALAKFSVVGFLFDLEFALLVFLKTYNQHFIFQTCKPSGGATHSVSYNALSALSVALLRILGNERDKATPASLVPTPGADYQLGHCFSTILF